MNFDEHYEISQAIAWEMEYGEHDDYSDSHAVIAGLQAQQAPARSTFYDQDGGFR